MSRVRVSDWIELESGEAITIDFIASEDGEFPIICSEYCGKGHDIMKGRLVVYSK